MKTYNIKPGLEEFSLAREQFAKIIAFLTSDSAQQLDHGNIEEKIMKEGWEILRRLLQGHLDLRANQEQKSNSIKTSSGMLLTQCRTGCKRKLESLFGEVTVKRMSYKQRGEESIFPLDSDLNLPVGKYSHGLQKLVAEESSKTSFDEVVKTIKKLTGGKVPKRQAEELTPVVSSDFDKYYTQKKIESIENNEDILVMSTDGKGIVMREDSLREATKKAAKRKKKEGPQLTRLKPGEKPNRKRMSTVVTVYTVAPYERTPKDIMAKPDESKKSIRPRPENKRIFASLQKDPDEVISEMFEEGERRDPKHLKKRVVLVDGAKHQLDLINNCIKRYNVEVSVILDFIHVLEYLWKAAHCFFDVGSEEAEKWVQERALKILQGKSSSVASGMRRSATMRKLKKSQRKGIDKCANYLLKYKSYLHYDKYLLAGFPIASGVIEGACRYLVKDRMDLTGARWGLRDAEAVLKLRALRASGDFDDYWKFHCDEELKRNYKTPCDEYELKKAA